MGHLRRHWKLWSVVLSLAAAPLFFWLLVLIQHQSEPVFEGRRIGEWFDDVCLNSGIAAQADPLRVQRRAAAMEAFARMDSNAIPFLVKIIETPDPKLQTTLIHKVAATPFLAPLSERLTLPSTKRMFAALALSQLGRKAEPAMPALVAAYNKSPDGFLLWVIASIMGMPRTIDLPADFVLWRASQRYPALFPLYLGPPSTNRTYPDASWPVF